MLQESASAIPSSIWATITCWFTPTVLFLLLNLMTGTTTSSTTNTILKMPKPFINRTHTTSSTITPQLDQTQRHFNFDDFQIPREGERFEESEQCMDEVYRQLMDAHFNRTKSDTKPASDEIPTKLSAKMKKSASLKSSFAHFKEDDVVEVRRPATVKEKGSAKATDANEKVDAKANVSSKGLSSS